MDKLLIYACPQSYYSNILQLGQHKLDHNIEN